MEAAAAARRVQGFQFRLYIAGPTSQSARALLNIRKLCELHLKGRYELEVIDICETPARASSEQIVAVPTLLKSHPLPPQRFVGDLADSAKILSRLELPLVPVPVPAP